MNENDIEIIDSTNDTETTEQPEAETETVEIADAEEPEVDVDELKKELATTKAQKEHWRNKAQKAKESTPVEQADSGGTSLKDQMALINAKVHEDDVDEVLDYAKFKKISISEALKSNVIKASLAEKAEQRATAEATNTSRSRGTSSKTTDEALLSKASKTGEIPDSEDDIKRMLDARYSK